MSDAPNVGNNGREQNKTCDASKYGVPVEIHSDILP